MGDYVWNPCTMCRFVQLVLMTFLSEVISPGWSSLVTVETQCLGPMRVRLCTLPKLLTLQSLEIVVSSDSPDFPGLTLSCPFTVPNASMYCDSLNCDLYTPKICETLGTCDIPNGWTNTTILKFLFSCDLPDDQYKTSTISSEVLKDTNVINGTDPVEASEALGNINILNVLIPICIVVGLLLLCGIIPLVTYCRKRYLQEQAKLQAVAKSLPCSNGEMASYSFTYENKYDFIGVLPDGRMPPPGQNGGLVMPGQIRPTSTNSDELYPRGINTLSDDVFPEYYSSKILRGHVHSKKTVGQYHNNLNVTKGQLNILKRKDKISKMRDSINSATIPEDQETEADVHNGNEAGGEGVPMPPSSSPPAHPYVNVPPPPGHQYENIAAKGTKEPTVQYAEIDILGQTPCGRGYKPSQGMGIITHKEVHMQYAQIKK